jgi:hypothetical protein
VYNAVYSDVQADSFGFLPEYMKAWIFQSLPERRDLRSELVEGKADTWRVSRYRSEISPGDLVFFWMAGDSDIRGIYGWGEVTTQPYFDKSTDQFRVGISYKRKLARPMMHEQLQDSGELSSLLILRAPFGSNFALSNHEASAIINLLPAAERPRP